MTVIMFSFREVLILLHGHFRGCSLANYLLYVYKATYLIIARLRCNCMSVCALLHFLQPCMHRLQRKVYVYIDNVFSFPCVVSIKRIFLPFCTNSSSYRLKFPYLCCVSLLFFMFLCAFSCPFIFGSACKYNESWPVGQVNLVLCQC